MATAKGKAPTRKQIAEAREREADNMFMSLGQVVSSTSHRDTIVTANLRSIRPDPKNGRLGQGELIGALAKITSQIKTLGSETVPNYAEIGIPLSPAGAALYESCAALANTYIPAGGYADTPPKVLPADEQGIYQTKTGHRRFIAYCLAEPITGINEIDVILDKSHKDGDNLSLIMGRITENTARENNSLAEELLQIKLVVDNLAAQGKSINKAKLARETGLERTRVSRLVEMVKAGAADNEERLLSIHAAKIEDAKALSYAFKAPPESWDALIQELSKIGPAAFRARYGSGKTRAGAPLLEEREESVAVPQPEPNDTHTSPQPQAAPEPETDNEHSPDTQASEWETEAGQGDGSEPAPDAQLKGRGAASVSRNLKPQTLEIKISEKSHGPAISRLFELLEQVQPGLTQQAVGNNEAERLSSLLAHLLQEG